MSEHDDFEYMSTIVKRPNKLGICLVALVVLGAILQIFLPRFGGAVLRDLVSVAFGTVTQIVLLALQKVRRREQHQST